MTPYSIFSCNKAPGTSVPADVSRDSLERHDGHRSCLLRDARLLGSHHVCSR
jgi:hypothetical protein